MNGDGDTAGEAETREEAFRRRLREAVSARGLSQAELARRLEVRRATVGEWLNHGRLPGGATMLQLPELLEVRADWLLLGAGRRDAGQRRTSKG